MRARNARDLGAGSPDVTIRRLLRAWAPLLPRRRRGPLTATMLTPHSKPRLIRTADSHPGDHPPAPNAPRTADTTPRSAPAITARAPAIASSKQVRRVSSKQVRRVPALTSRPFTHSPWHRWRGRGN
jgi:hypothetical protein